MQAVARLRLDATSFGFSACCLAAAAMIGWLVLGINRERACALQESLSVGLCAPPAAASAADLELLRSRIARDPGDANAYTALALADRSPLHGQLVEVASRLAPREPNLLLERASAAVARTDWAAAVPPLVELADRRDVTPAVTTLAYIVGIGQGALLEPYLTPGSQWLQRMLTQMRAAGVPFSGALPLAIQARRRGVIDDDTVRGYVRELKAQNAWSDAYALWLSLHGKAVPALFNASFDHAFELDGFDWEVPATGPARRAGAIAARRREDARGSVLELQFTGRAIGLPIVRQYLFIGPGHYRLRGDYLGHQFRSEEGLRWIVRCGADTVGSSPALADSSGLWRPFAFDFIVPPDCGLVASLQLETGSAAAAALGARGRALFDAFQLERTGP